MDEDATAARLTAAGTFATVPVAHPFGGEVADLEESLVPVVPGSPRESRSTEASTAVKTSLGGSSARPISAISKSEGAPVFWPTKGSFFIPANVGHSEQPVIGADLDLAISAGLEAQPVGVRGP